MPPCLQRGRAPAAAKGRGIQARRPVLSLKRTVVWSYAPGYFNGPLRSAEAMRELTGLHLVPREAPDRVQARISLNGAGIALMEGGAFPVPAAFLRQLARSAGVHIYNDADDTLYASRSHITLAADKAGRRTVRLPRRCDVFDPFTGECLWRNVAAVEREFQAKEVVIWRLG